MDAAHTFRQILLKRLESGQWSAGDRLPTERAFCEQFRISRTTVRKVLMELKACGWIRQTVGSGTYVSERASAATTPLRSVQLGLATSPAEIMEARLALEPSIVYLVIANASASDFERMHASCERAEAATTHEEFEMWDGQFHEVIAQATHNSIITNVFRMLNEARSRGEWGTLKKRSFTDERRQMYQRQHRALLKALRERDPQEARGAAEQHLMTVRRNLLNY